MKFTAPAKVNLYLDVIRKMEDGYHEIETLFEKISLVDHLYIELSEKPTCITCNDSRVPTGPGSLMYNVLEAFQKESVSTANFKVVLEKNIPVAAGLGGGSSDAATLLKGVNELTGYPLKNEALHKIGRAYGADIPFFLEDQAFGIGRGRGDIISSVASGAEIWHILINPPFEVSTRDVYEGLSPLSLTKKEGVDRMFTTFLKEKNIKGMAENLHNDLQTVTLGKFPVLRQVFSALRDKGAKGVLLSGSGPTVFGVFDAERALQAKEELEKVFPKEQDWHIFVAHTYRG